MALEVRIFWAVEACGLAPQSTTNYIPIHGLQSCGLSTTFNLTNVFELGQLALYDFLEDVPNIEIATEKALDGYPLIYHLATRGYGSNNTMVGRSNQRSNFAMSIFGDTQSSASGIPNSEVYVSGCYVSSEAFDIPVEGFMKETCNLVANNIIWKSGTAGAYPIDFSGQIFTNTDSPLALASGFGGVQRRQNLVFATTMWATGIPTYDINGSLAATDATILPQEIAGISASGTNDLIQGPYGTTYSAHLQNIKVTADLGRDAIYELGRRAPYFRFLKFPVDVNTEIEVLTTLGNLVNGVETAVNNLNFRSIRVYVQEGTFLNLGVKNKLTSTAYSGGSTGGENATVTYSYTNRNDFIVTHPQDPT